MSTEPNILDTVAAATCQRVDAAKQHVPLADVRATALAMDANTGFPFDRALRGDDIAFICECKQASPSKGLIAQDYPYVDIARSYQDAGANAISVLTEPQWFKGSPQHLKEIAAAVDIPVLRKDFVVDPYQIYEAKTLGASAILLICSILTDDQLAEYHQVARSLGMSALVEAHNQVEIDRALLAGASIIGVNNRDLRDFTVEPERAASFREQVPADVAFVAESGISTPLQVDTLRAPGVNAVLIGETLMRAKDRRAMLAYLRGPSQVSATVPVSRGGRQGFGHCSRNCAMKATDFLSPAAASRTDTVGAAPTSTKLPAPTQPAKPLPPLTRPPLVKLCGMMRTVDVQVANRVRPDFVGFTFATSPRKIAPEQAEDFRHLLDPSIPAVGVFQDDELSLAAALANAGTIQVIQLHGQESDADIRQLKEATGRPVWKAFKVRTIADVQAANGSEADVVLLDSGGGTGRTFDWTLLAHVTRPFFLAGGLTSDNVAEAVRDIHPFGVDVSSGIETNGFKDAEKMHRFVLNARHAAQALTKEQQFAVPEGYLQPSASYQNSCIDQAVGVTERSAVTSRPPVATGATAFAKEQQ